MMPKNKK
jgi:FKBP-type peptidyl-prolyl cis-trans isomerase (trigger factor)